MTRKKRRLKRTSVIKSLNDVNTTVARGTHIFTIMSIIIFIAGLMIGFIWQKVKIAQLVEEIEKLRKEELILRERNEKKRAIVLNLLNDSRILNIAEKELHMINPPFEIVYLPNNFESQMNVVEKLLAQNE